MDNKRDYIVDCNRKYLRVNIGTGIFIWIDRIWAYRLMTVVLPDLF